MNSMHNKNYTKLKTKYKYMTYINLKKRKSLYITDFSLGSHGFHNAHYYIDISLIENITMFLV